MDYTKSKGNVVELQCISKFIEMGFDCSIPYGDASKYDFIADIGGELLRIQCKSCSNPVKNGKRDTQAISFSCHSQTTNTKKTIRHSYTDKDIDYFATYYEGKVYLIPVVECSLSKTLRFSPPNNGRTDYNKAEDYLIEKVLGHLQDKAFINQSDNDNKKENKKIFICSQCNKNIVYKEGGICHECASFNKRIYERPSREELKSLIRFNSFLKLGKQFGVSDNTIRRWCKSYNLPNKTREIKKYSDLEWSNI